MKRCSEGVRVALCIINLNEQSYNSENTLLITIAKIENVLKVWRTRDLTIKGKIVIFKSLAISKSVHLVLIKTVPIFYCRTVEHYKKNSIWQRKKAKMKYSTLCNSYENGGLKEVVDIFCKIMSLQCSWIRRLFGNNFYVWKVIPLFLMKKKFWENFKFHSNIDISKCTLNSFLRFHMDILTQWSNIFLFLLACLEQLLLSFYGWINI